MLRFAEGAGFTLFSFFFLVFYITSKMSDSELESGSENSENGDNSEENSEENDVGDAEENGADVGEKETQLTWQDLV